MNVERFNPAIGILLLLLVTIAIAIAVSANTPRSGLGQAPPSVTPETPTPIPSSPVSTSTITSTVTPDATFPPPIGTAVRTVIVPTPPTTTPLPQLTATVEAWWTAVSEYGRPIPDPNESTQIAEAQAFRSLFTLEGTVIAQGVNATPTGHYNLLTYRVEEVQLPGPTTFTRLTVGRNITVDKVWRVIISGGPFEVRATSVDLYLDGNGITSGGESPDLTEVIFLVFDRSLLQEGATIAISYYGDLDNSTLPETLHFSP